MTMMTVVIVRVRHGMNLPNQFFSKKYIMHIEYFIVKKVDFLFMAHIYSVILMD